MQPDTIFTSVTTHAEYDQGKAVGAPDSLSTPTTCNDGGFEFQGRRRLRAAMHQLIPAS
jgi:hypothetical protein